MKSPRYEDAIGAHAMDVAESLFGLVESDIVGHTRLAELVEARTTIIKAMSLLDLPVSVIARIMNRDHSTIHYHLSMVDHHTEKTVAIVESARERMDLDIYPKRYLIWTCSCGQENVLEAISSIRRSLVCTHCDAIRLKTTKDHDLLTKFARDPRPAVRAAVLLEGATTTLLRLTEDRR